MSTAQKLLERSRKTVTIGDLSFQIRKLSIREVVEIFKGIPDILSLVDRAQKKEEGALEEFQNSPDKQQIFYDRIEMGLKFGLISPKIGDEVLFSDLSLTEAMQIFAEILAISEVSKEGG